MSPNSSSVTCRIGFLKIACLTMTISQVEAGFYVKHIYNKKEAVSSQAPLFQHCFILGHIRESLSFTLLQLNGWQQQILSDCCLVVLLPITLYMPILHHSTFFHLIPALTMCSFDHDLSLTITMKFELDKLDCIFVTYQTLTKYLFFLLRYEELIVKGHLGDFYQHRVKQ